MAERFSREELVATLAKMGIGGCTDVSRYGSGHINDTFKVETESGVRYILQRVNTSIFDVDLLKENVVRVTEYMKAKGVKSLEVVAYDNPWRIYKFLEGYTSRDVVEEPRQAYDVARAFAKFQNDLAGFPEPRLKDIIPKYAMGLYVLNSLAMVRRTLNPSEYVLSLDSLPSGLSRYSIITFSIDIFLSIA